MRTWCARSSRDYCVGPRRPTSGRRRPSRRRSGRTSPMARDGCRARWRRSWAIGARSAASSASCSMRPSGIRRIGRIGTLLGQYFDGDASKLAVLLDPTRLGSPLHQFRTEIADGFRGVHERLAALEAAHKARAEERAKGTAKGGDFEDVLEGMLGRDRPWCGGSARPHRHGRGRGAEVQEGRLRADHRLAARAWRRPARGRRGQGPTHVDARHPG